MISLEHEPKGHNFTVPDVDRVKEGVQNQMKLASIMRIYNNSNQRINHNVKRLQADMQQLRSTISQIREDLKTVEVMEQRIAKEFEIKTDGITQSMSQFNTFLIEWTQTIKDKEASIAQF